MAARRGVRMMSKIRAQEIKKGLILQGGMRI